MLTGIPASSGAAIGPFFLLNTNIPIADAQQSHLSAEQETQSLTAAIARVGADLDARAGRTAGELHEILVAMAEIATDPAIAEEAAAFIAGGRTASYAIVKATEVFQELLTASGGYLAERVSDVANAIIINKGYIQAETIAFVNQTYPGFFANANNFIDVANAQAKCSRDVGYILGSGCFWC